MTVLYRPMVARDPGEEHRASTPLELLVDLCFVVAVAGAAAGLHHGLAEVRVGHAVVTYLVVFFAIWWAWMNFSWFASSYDTDDAIYRVLTFVQMAGILVLAAGIPDAFDDHYTRVAVGFLILRLGLAGQWLRVTRTDPGRARTAWSYAIGYLVLQAAWILRLALPEPAGAIGLGVLIVAELTLPAVVERSGTPTWHPQHIAERFGLFTIIVLGESILAVSKAIGEGLDHGGITGDLVMVAVGAGLILFAMWWRYFDIPAEDALRRSPRLAHLWSYVHFVVFASIAAIGAGLEVVAGGADSSDLTATAVAATIALPLVLFLAATAFLQFKVGASSRVSLIRAGSACGAVAVVAASTPVIGLPGAILGLGLVLVAGLASVVFVATTEAHSAAV